MLDILIKNGIVIDGTGAVPKNLDVAIQKGRIVEVAAKISGNALQTIDAKGSFVSPGFIDIQNHSDSYWTLFNQPEQASLLAQGITTIIVGNCGASLAPLLSQESIKGIQKWHSLQGINLNWTSVAEFLQLLSQVSLGVNVGTLIGHSTLRRGLIGDEIRHLSGEEIKVLDKIIATGLAEGALGLSMGLIYAHEVNASGNELEILSRNLLKDQKYLSIHLRSEASHILESRNEVIDLSKQTGVAVKISHLKLRGKKNWPLFDQVLDKLEQAYHQGVKISFDVYPYDTSWSVLYTYLPKWAYEGGRDNILSAIASLTNRRKILDYLRQQGHDFGSILVAEASGNQNFVGKTIRQIAENLNVTKEEAMLNIIAATKAQVVVFDHNLSPDQVEKLLASPLSMIATDGSGYSKRMSELIHPRCFGTMPRFLSLIREKKILKWEQAIKKITSEPAKLLGLPDRGRIVPKLAGDIVIFDPQTIAGHTDYTNPDILPEGVEFVLINGKIALDHDRIMNLAGQVIKR